jgi:phosphatidylserine/phosphatidylglycerophosphate/cardiolipin synthase-like enzyme
VRTASEPLIPVQPLMTPDNYGKAILDLIGGAKTSLFMQYSYIRGPKNNDLYRELLKAVASRMHHGVDVRVIVDGRNEADEDVDLVLALGWDSSRWRRQISAVHNKGIIVDGCKTVVGSQNWSSDGTQINRDASLIFDDAESPPISMTCFSSTGTTSRSRSARRRRCRSWLPRESRLPSEWSASRGRLGTGKRPQAALM